MKIKGFIWFEDIIQKLLWKHHVTQKEVAELFDNSPRFFFVEKGNRKDENVYTALGQTVGGRYLAIYFIYKENHQALILSARDMTKAERTKYGRK